MSKTMRWPQRLAQLPGYLKEYLKEHLKGHLKVQSKGLLMGFALAMLVAPPTVAEVYRWVDESGKIHFSDQAPAEDEKVERVEIDQPQRISTDSDEQINSKIAAVDRMARDRRHSESQQRWQHQRAKNTKKRNQKTCQYYRDKLANLEYRWKLQRKNGYRQWQKDRYLGSRDRYQRDIKRHC